MNELKVAIASALLEQRSLGQLLKSWQVGQVLQARVLDTQANGRLILGVGTQQLVATSDVSVPKGAMLSLQVNSLFPVPSLQVRNFPLHSPVPVNPEQQRLQQLLPRQGSVSAPLVTLLNPEPEVNILSVLGAKTELLERLNKTMAQLGMLTSLESLQSSVARSGLFFEADLAQGLAMRTAVGQQDLKALLLRLQQQIREVASRIAPGTLASANEAALASLRAQVEGALAAITLNQMAVTASDVRPGGLWLFDMPFLVRGALRDLALTIEQREAREQEDEALSKEWRAVIRVELPHLGPVEAELFLREQRVSVAIYAPKPEGARLLDRGLSVFRETLERCNLQVAVLRVHPCAREEVDDGARWQPGLDVTV